MNLPDPHTDIHHIPDDIRPVSQYRVQGYRCPCGSRDITASTRRLFCGCGNVWSRIELKWTGGAH